MTPAEQAGFKVGSTGVLLKKEFGIPAGSRVELVEDDDSIDPKFALVGRGPGASKFGVRAFIPISNVQLDAPGPLTHLPPKFKLNPAGNEELSRAMQERLFELGCRWHKLYDGRCKTQPTYTEYPWLMIRGDKIGGNLDDYYDYPLLTLDDLYRLTPAPKELPKLEFAGRTLELKDGRVVGREFSEDLKEFKRKLNRLLGNEPADKLGGHAVTYVIPQVNIGYQITRKDLERALEWALEVSK